jgi:DNA-binding MarR family transcriptional regulator
MATARKRKNDPSAANFSLEDYPFYLMTRTMAGYYAMLEKALKKAGVDQPRWRVLMILGAKNPSNMSELSERSVIKNSTMTRLIQRMQRQGMVRCARHSGDNRISEVYLTPLGRQRLRMVRTIGGQIFRQTFGTVADRQVKEFVAILKRMIDRLHHSAFAIPDLSVPRTVRVRSSRRAGGR